MTGYLWLKIQTNQAVFLFSLLCICPFVSVATDSKDEELKIPKRLFMGTYTLQCVSAVNHHLQFISSFHPCLITPLTFHLNEACACCQHPVVFDSGHSHCPSNAAGLHVSTSLLQITKKSFSNKFHDCLLHVLFAQSRADTFIYCRNVRHRLTEITKICFIYKRM